MLRRLLLGLAEGLVIGLALGIGSARALGLVSPSGIVLALLGAFAGFAVGLVAGRPVWAPAAKTEAILKALAGALGGVGLSFALRRWLRVDVDLSAFSLGAGAAGSLPPLALPAIAVALGLFFELDDDGRRNSVASGAGVRAKHRVELEDMGSPAPSDEQELPAEVARKFEKR